MIYELKKNCSVDAHKLIFDSFKTNSTVKNFGWKDAFSCLKCGVQRIYRNDYSNINMPVCIKVSRLFFQYHSKSAFVINYYTDMHIYYAPKFRQALKSKH